MSQGHDMASLQERYIRFMNQVADCSHALGRTAAQVCVVSKGRSAQEIRALYEVGCRDFAENRLEQLQEKSQALGDCKQLRWHFIGHIQSRKISKLITSEIPLYSIHSIHDLPTLLKVETRSHNLSRSMNVFLQVNVTGEVTKQGLTPQDWLACVDALIELKSVNIIGLMTMAPLGSSSEFLYASFGKLQSLQRKMSEYLPSCMQLSMGMSEDWQEALACGATWLRIGSAIFLDTDRSSSLE